MALKVHLLHAHLIMRVYLKEQGERFHQGLRTPLSTLYQFFTVRTAEFDFLDFI